MSDIAHCSTQKEIALPQWHSSGLPSTPTQRIFVAVLLLLAVVASYLVVFHFDPQAATLHSPERPSAQIRITKGARLP